MSLVFNDWTTEAEQRKVCEKFDLTMDEDLPAKFKQWKGWDDALKSKGIESNMF